MPSAFEPCARDAGQNALNTGRPVLYGTGHGWQANPQITCFFIISDKSLIYGLRPTRLSSFMTEFQISRPRLNFGLLLIFWIIDGSGQFSDSKVHQFKSDRLLGHESSYNLGRSHAHTRSKRKERKTSAKKQQEHHMKRAATAPHPSDEVLNVRLSSPPRGPPWLTHQTLLLSPRQWSRCRPH